MGFFSDVAKVVTGGLPGLIEKAIDKVFPDSTTPEQREQKARMEFEMQRVIYEHELHMQEAANEADAEFNRRTESLEGTAKDLALLGWVGKAILAIRSIIRPGITICVVVWDWKILAGSWNLPKDGGLISNELFFLLNFVTMVFWFGERAVVNALPALGQWSKYRAEAKYIKENGPTQ